jgi:exosome complex RNA-binding protein Rrp42 (RNase PH superfamily)
MTGTIRQERQAVKTPDAVFYQALRQEFNFSLRLAQDVLNAAQELLIGQASPERIRPGQVRRVVASLKAPFGPPLVETAKLEITLTVDAGPEDAEVAAEQGREALRRGRILRLIDEALDQGGVLTQEDLAQVLGVDVRTIRRDVRVLKEAGQLLHTRGQLKGVGRG